MPVLQDLLDKYPVIKSGRFYSGAKLIKGFSRLTANPIYTSDIKPDEQYLVTTIQDSTTFTQQEATNV